MAMSVDTKANEGRLMGLPSGVGMVVANMIGAGVFLSAGFMAQDLGPDQILLAWVLGLGLALSGAWTYAAIATRIPRSGGEYRYLSTLLHPALGYLAGWASLLLGFSAPIAVDALAAAAFGRTLSDSVPAKPLALGLVAALTALHAIGMRTSVRTQNALVLFKSFLLAGFLAVGLIGGSHAWPTWKAPGSSVGFPLAAFMGSLFYIAFAFSGWNAAIYAAEEFKQPKRDVPRAMLIGCGAVGILYLLVNWVFVASLTPKQAEVVFQYESARVTLGHLVTRDIIGEAGGSLMSILLIVAFISAMSAMTFLGPRVYAAMARDGFLPRVLAGREGRPPVGALILQGILAALIVYFYELQQVLQNVGAILTLFAALTALGLVRWYLRGGRLVDGTVIERPPASSLVTACIYVASSAWMLYFGFKNSPTLLLWVGAVAAAALVAFFLTPKRASGAAPSAGAS
jgi:APA family basic amino acid/polyamine antiporter